jgi:hypothetical protein
MQCPNLKDPELRKLVEESMNITAPEEIVFDEEELRMYEGYNLEQVRAEVRKMNMEIDGHTQMTPNDVRKVIKKNEVGKFYIYFYHNKNTNFYL